LERWRARSVAVSVADVLGFLERESDRHPAVKNWRPSTWTKLAQSILAALRDFSVLRGIYAKQIQCPVVSLETVFHLLCVLLAEGHHGRAVIEAPDWRVFLWSEDDTAKALADLAQRRWIHFERGGIARSSLCSKRDQESSLRKWMGKEGRGSQGCGGAIPRA
jgi:hypothetical protein